MRCNNCRRSPDANRHHHNRNQADDIEKRSQTSREQRCWRSTRAGQRRTPGNQPSRQPAKQNATE
jgi:hypothetical protein